MARGGDRGKVSEVRRGEVPYSGPFSVTWLLFLASGDDVNNEEGECLVGVSSMGGGGSTPLPPSPRLVEREYSGRKKIICVYALFLAKLIVGMATCTIILPCSSYWRDNQNVKVGYFEREFKIFKLLPLLLSFSFASPRSRVGHGLVYIYIYLFILFYSGGNIWCFTICGNTWCFTMRT